MRYKYNTGQCVKSQNEETGNNHNDTEHESMFRLAEAIRTVQSSSLKSTYIFAQQCALSHRCFGKWHSALSGNIGTVTISNGCDPLKLHSDPLGFQQPSLHMPSLTP